MGLRKLSPSDKGIITELFLSVFTKEPWNDDWSDTAQLNAYIDDLTGNKNSLTFGYFDDCGRMIALSMGSIRHWYRGTEYYIDEFCVDRELQRQGVGSAFLRDIEDYISENGMRHIFLQTDRTVPAYLFYRTCGFEELADHVSFARTIYSATD